MHEHCSGTDRAAAGVNCIMSVFGQQAADCNNCCRTGCLYRTVGPQHSRKDIDCSGRIRLYGQAPYLHLCISSYRSFDFIVGDRRSCRDTAFCFIGLNVRSDDARQSVCVIRGNCDNSCFFRICTADCNVLSDPGNRLRTGQDDHQASAEDFLSTFACRSLNICVHGLSRIRCHSYAAAQYRAFICDYGGRSVIQIDKEGSSRIADGFCVSISL